MHSWRAFTQPAYLANLALMNLALTQPACLANPGGCVPYGDFMLVWSHMRRVQDDVLYETLTVYETLMYAGMLRLPRTMSKAEKVSRMVQHAASSPGACLAGQPCCWETSYGSKCTTSLA